ncbi:MAG: hypothetical protein AB7F78_25075 [Hyphomicrobiaceae bacterium]
MNATIISALERIADEVGVDLRGYFKPGEKPDFDEIIAMLRHWTGEAKVEALNEIDEQFDNIENALVEIEEQIAEAADTEGASASDHDHT